MTSSQLSATVAEITASRTAAQAKIDAAQKTMAEAQSVIDAAQVELDGYAKQLADLAKMTPDDAPMQIYFADTTGKKVADLANTTKAKLSGLTIAIVPAPKKIEAYRDGKLVYTAPFAAVAKGLLSTAAYAWNIGKYDIHADSKSVGTFTVADDVQPPVTAPSQPNTPPVNPPTPPVVTPSNAKPQNQTSAADVALKNGAVVVEEGFPFFLHTRGLSQAAMSWVPNLPMHNFDFDWSMEGMARFAQARGRCYAGILPAGTHAGSLVITHPKSGASGKLTLSVTAIATSRKSVVCKSESELRAALFVPGTDAHLGADITLNNSIAVASMTRLFGEGHTLSSNVKGATIIQPRGADGFVMRDLTIEALTTNDNDTFLSPNGTRFAAVNVMVNRALHFVNANGKPSGLLVEDVRTRDQNSIVKYLVWNDASYAVLRGLWCDNAIKEHCIRGGPQCAAYDRCYLTNVDEVNDPIMYAKGTITAHCPKDLSIDLCSCGRDGDGSRGGDIGFGPLTPLAANTPADQTSANNISVTRTFMRKGATVAVRAGTLGCRVQDCKTDFTTWNCFAISGIQKIAGVQPATDVTFVNDGVGADPTPKWTNKVVSA